MLTVDDWVDDRQHVDTADAVACLDDHAHVAPLPPRVAPAVAEDPVGRPAVELVADNENVVVDGARVAGRVSVDVALGWGGGDGGIGWMGEGREGGGEGEQGRGR